MLILKNLKSDKWGLPSGPLVKTLPSSAGDAGLIPGRGTKIPHAPTAQPKGKFFKILLNLTFTE